MKNKKRVVDTRVSIIIVNWNGKHLLTGCLDSLKKQTFRDFEAIVVDNGSSDGSAEFVKAKYPWVRVIENSDNLGFARANNIGIAASKSEYVALLNNDIVADKKWLEEMVAHADSCPPTVGSFASRMMLYKKPNVVNSTGIVFFRSGGGVDRDAGRELDSSCDLSEDVAGACAGAALYRRKALEEVSEPEGQCFSNRFFMYFEDLDLAYRLQWAGFSCKYVHSAFVLHHHQASSKKKPTLAIWQGHLNRQRNVLRNFTWKMISYNMRWLVVTDILECGFVFLVCSPLAPFRAKWQILKEFSTHRAWHKELMRRFGKNERHICMLMKNPPLKGAVGRRLSAMLAKPADGE